MMGHEGVYEISTYFISPDVHLVIPVLPLQSSSRFKLRDILFLSPLILLAVVEVGSILMVECKVYLNG
jgi:hypothetical protein